MTTPFYPRYLLPALICVGFTGCDQMKETQARRGELRDRSEALIQETALLDPKIQAAKSTLPATLHNVQAATFHADKLDKDYQSMADQLNQAIKQYSASEAALKALQAEVETMRSQVAK